MGCLQLKRWLSFLPAAFVVYILLHYFVYQPDIQDTHSTFLGSSSSRRIVKLSASDPIEIKEPVHLPNVELRSERLTSPSDVVTDRDTSPSPVQEANNGKPKLNDLSSESQNKLEPRDIFDDQYNNNASATANVATNDKSPTVYDVLSNNINSRPQDSNKDESLFAHSSAVNDYIVKSFQLKRALELKSMLASNSESRVAKYLPDGSGNVKPILEDTRDNIYSVVKDTADEPIVKAVNDFYPASSERKTNTNVFVSPLEDLKEQPLNTFDTRAGELSLTVMNYDTQHVNNIGGEADITKGMGQVFPSEQDSIIVARELLSREDNNMKKNYEPSTSIEEKETATNLDEIRNVIPEGSGISVAANFNSTEMLNSLVDAAQNEKSQLRPIVKKVEEINSTAERLVPELKSNSSMENQSQQISSKKAEPLVPKSETPPIRAAAAAASLPVQSKSSPHKLVPKLPPAAKAKSQLHRRTDPPGYAIKALNGPISVGQRYEKGFATAHEDLCPNNGRDLKVLILITSAPDHEKHRNAVRQTWGHFSMRRDIAMAFVVGRTARTDVQNVIDKENDRYGDIIEANFVDHYSNLTLKTVSMFEWAKTYCSEARFVLKTDDDMYINVPLLLAFIIAKNNEKRAMFGRLAKGWKPVRNTKSKYYIDTSTYSRVRYPDFLTGPAYLFTNDVVEEMYLKVLNTTFFVLEDVLITGIVGESLGVKRVGDSHFRNEKIKLADTCKLMQSISIHMVKYEEQFDIYKRTLDGKTKCKTR